jgi:carbonic anhydrase
MRTEYNLDYVDMVTEAGPIGILCEDRESTIVKSIRRRVEISITKHNSKLIAVVGHYDCAGNPVERDTQLEQMRTAIRVVESWNSNALVIGLWVDKSWTVHEIE